MSEVVVVNEKKLAPQYKVLLHDECVPAPRRTRSPRCPLPPSLWSHLLLFYLFHLPVHARCPRAVH
jgi:hypothetical protein